MPHSKSSKRWLKEHFKDHFVKQAQTDGYRSRAVYKLKEIDEKEHLFKKGMTIIELGAAPGSWTQYISEKLQGCGTIVALDNLLMEPIPGVHFIQGDFCEEKTVAQLIKQLPQGVDLLLSDMAPNMSGSPAIDIPRVMYLAELVFSFSTTILKIGGTLLLKLFQGQGFDELIKCIRLKFAKVVVRKPSASRSRSKETYLLAKGYNS